MFLALVYDKYGDQMKTSTITWSVDGQGTITPDGLYTAPATTGGPHYVIASTIVNGITITDTGVVYVQATQSITCHEFDSVYYLHDPFPLQCFSSSGLPVQYERISGPITLNGDTVSLLGVPGIAYISAEQPGSQMYQAAPAKLIVFYISSTEPDDIIIENIQEKTYETFFIYPNPSDGMVYMSDNPDHVRLMDTRGSVLENMDVPVKSIDISRYTPGLYILEINLRGNKIFEKIIKK